MPLEGAFMSFGRIAAAVVVLAGVVSLCAGCIDLDSVERTISPYSESAPPTHRYPDAGNFQDVEIPSLPDGFAVPDVDNTSQELVLNQVEPGQGDIKGGDLVMLVGTGFVDNMQVYFSEAKASQLFVVSPNFATVLTPPHLPGLVDITVIGNDGDKSFILEAFLYTADLTVEAVEPTEGPVAGATPLVVTGTGYDESCKLFVGHSMASYQTVIDSFTMEGVAPPGACGDADVTVSCDEATAFAPDAFHYAGPPELTLVEPAVGPAQGGLWVDVKGAYFSPLTTVTFGGAPAQATQYVGAQLLLAQLPVGVEGPVAVEVANECGTDTLPKGFVYVSPAGPEPGPPTIIATVPDRLPACSGGYVTLVVNGLHDGEELFVFIGDVSTDIVSVDYGAGTIDVLVGPVEPGPADLLLLSSAGNDLSEGAFLFEDIPAIFSLNPASGSVEGGDQVLIKGCGFDDTNQQFSEVWYGATVSPDVTVLDSERVVAVAPPGAPGPVDVTVVTGGAAAKLSSGYSYVSEQPELYYVSPEFGAVSGGTYVRFVGAGLPSNASYFIGDRQCFDVHYIHSSLVTARVPSNEPGTYDARIEWAGGLAGKTAAFTYFNPKSKKGGTWGGPIDESINVTVLDGSNGKGLPAAFVLVGEDLSSPHQGFTDEDGQITFSVPGLQGKQTVTASKPAYNLYSVVHFDATNVTVYLNPKVLPGGGGSYNPPKAYVGGRVSGFDKYALIPPGDCNSSLFEDQTCAPCSTDEDCATEAPELPSGDVISSEVVDSPEVHVCAPVTGKGDFCLPVCQQTADCPMGFGCAKVGPESTACIPLAGEKHIRCETSKTSMFGYPPNPGPGGIVNDHDIYFINAPPGEFAVVCFGGYKDYYTSQFHPTVLGLKRHVIALKNDVLKDRDVVLNIPLTRQGKLAFHTLPWHPEGVRKPYVIMSIELGKDGYMSLPKTPQWEEAGEYYLIDPLPDQMSGTLEGATYSLYASVQSDTLYSLPYAVKMETKIPTLDGDGMILISPAGTSNMYPPVAGDVVGLSYRSSADVYVASSKGELLHFDGVAWTPAGVPNSKEGFTCMFEDNVGGLWLGGKQGSVWHFSGVGWTYIEPTVFQPVEDLWGANGEAWVVHKALVAHITDDIASSVEPAPEGYQLSVIWGSDSKDLWIASDNSSLWNLGQTGWVKSVAYTGYELQDIDGTGPDDIWAVATPSMVLHFDGTYFDLHHPSPDKDLVAVHAFAPGKVYAAGKDGALFALQDGEFVQVETNTVEDFLAVSYSGAEDLLVAAGVQAYNVGPFMAYPRVLAPAKDEYFAFDKVSWEFWTGGAQADFINLTFSTADGFPFWIMVVDGAVSEVVLPPISLALGVNVIPEGDKRLNMSASMNPIFNIDQYNNGDFSMYDRISWAVELTLFK